MKTKKFHFVLMSLVALVLVLGSGFVLKFATPESQAVAWGWGAIFLAGCIFFVRSMLLINKVK